MDLKKLRVPLPDNNPIVLYPNGDTQDIIKVIMHADSESRKRDLVGDVPTILKGATDKETFENVWDFVKYEMTYKTDAAGFEKVKAPNWMLYNRVGDCKSYSVLIAAIIRKLGYKYKYRLVGFDSDKENPTHVYIVAFTKKGEVIILDAVHTTFNDEPNHTFQFDRSPGNGISGIRF